MAAKTLVVIGGGAAGFFCAVNAARLNPSLQIILLEKSNKLLSKVRVSGGGRCNLTHACFDIGEMSRQYPRGQNFVKKTFHQFFTADTIRWFEERGVKTKTEADGRIFPVSDSSQTIIDCLLKEASKHRVDIRMNTEVKKIVKQDSLFTVHCSNGKDFKAEFICIACGGFPKSSMFGWLEELGHSINEPVPSLFSFNLPAHPIKKLMGVSAENVRIKIAGTRLNEEGPLLITHWGLSGPAVLKLSAWGAKELKALNYEFTVLINWISRNENEIRNDLQLLKLNNGSQKVFTRNSLGLSQRLWEFLAAESGITHQERWADLSSATLNKLINNLTAYLAEVKGKTTFKEEFVTAGGIRLDEVDANTMMSKKVPGLFFAGEILDVDGVTGGYNFQHAWTSGFVAARAIASLTE